MSRIVYMRTSGGVPPNFLRLTLEPDGTAVAERHHQFPPPAIVTVRNGRYSLEHTDQLRAVFAELDLASLTGPPADSPNEWFELEHARAFSIVSLYPMSVPSVESPMLARIQAALSAIFEQIGGPP